MSDAIGVRAAVRYRDLEWIEEHRAEYWIRPKQIKHPVCVRSRTSDADVFRQIFIEQEFRCLDALPDVKLVIDCGANVGYSGAYFLSRHPHCRVVAIEPDPGNFSMLQRNLARYGKRAELINAGIWSHAAPLVVSRQKYRDGREWARQVRECGPDEPEDVRGVDVESLLAASGFDRISILKMDIEGAEAVVFQSNYQSWIDRVDAIAIELHDDTGFGNASETFHSAVAGRGFEVSRSGELVICTRLSLSPVRKMLKSIKADLT